MARRGAAVPGCPLTTVAACAVKNRLQYCALAEQFKLREFDVQVRACPPPRRRRRIRRRTRCPPDAAPWPSPQVEAMRRGFFTVVPQRALSLLTWQELELMVSGRPFIDVEQLRLHTDYEGYRADDATVKLFWRVFESLSDDERSKFIRFAWGRSRLPVAAQWGKRFKLQRRATSETQLPLAHTCFFSVELPPYTSEARMRRSLLACIHFGVGGILNA